MRRRRNRGGFSVLEVLIVLAIMSVGAAIVMPRGAAMLDRMTTHVVFFEFQQQVSERRRAAFRSERAAAVPVGGLGAADELSLRPGWTYRLDQPLEITAGGRCGAVEAGIFREERLIMRLRSDDGACHFIRRS